MFQEMGKHIHSHIFSKEPGMSEVAGSLIQHEDSVPGGKLRPERGVQGPDFLYPQTMLKGLGFVMKAVGSWQRT